MKIRVRNLGPLRQAEFELGDFTIICGENNTGKTYATYSLFGFLSFWRSRFSIRIHDAILTQLLTEGSVAIPIADFLKEAPDTLSARCKSYSEQLPMVFAAAKEKFADSEFHVEIDPTAIHPAETFERRMGAAETDIFSIIKQHDSSDVIVSLLVERDKVRIPRDIMKAAIGDSLKDIVFGNLFPRPFIASAERTGAAIFRKELNFARNRLLEQMGQSDKDIDPFELLVKVYQDYPLPVKNNVDFTRQLETLAKNSSFLYDQHPDVLADFADIIGGDYLVTKNDELFFKPKAKNIKLTMAESSSSVRSLLDIGFYLRHVAAPGDLLMVDEPELNLHPENQRRVARLFARVVNLGIKVFITTHSDYIIKELNTLIMLNHDKPHLARIAHDEGYVKAELLAAPQLRVFIAEEALTKLDNGQRRTKCLTFTQADIDPELGIEARSFDKTIETMNRIQEEIVWGGEPA